jgi:hypothetical protein
MEAIGSNRYKVQQSGNKCKKRRSKMRIDCMMTKFEGYKINANNIKQI